MPLVYQMAKHRRDKIAMNLLLKELEIAGFLKGILGDKIKHFADKQTRIASLWSSLLKQIDDLKAAPSGYDTLEALADLRNLCGLLFVETVSENEQR